MKPRLHLFLVPVCFGLTAAQAAGPFDAKVYKKTNFQIAELFRLQDQTRPEINARNNPFRASGEFPAEGNASIVPADGKPAGPISDEALLAQAVATLKVTGVMQVAGNIRLTINRAIYAEGDIVQVRLDRGTVLLRVGNITDKRVTFRLNAAELILDF